MIKKLNVNYQTKLLIELACLEYKRKFMKHRKEVSHFSKGGLYQEWEKNKYKEKNNERIR